MAGVCLEGSAPCSQISHTSGPAISGTNLAGSPDRPKVHNVHPTVTIPKSTIHVQNANISYQDNGPESLRLQKMYDKQNIPSPVASPRTASPIIGSLPPGSRIPDPLKLQMKFDMKQEGQDSREIARKIDQLELENLSSLVPSSSEIEEYVSDPKKIAQIQAADAELRKENPEMKASLIENEFDIPKTDPAKLKAMKMFDAKNSLTKISSDGNELESDSSKLKKIEEFDKKIMSSVPAESSDKISVTNKIDNVRNVSPVPVDDHMSKMVNSHVDSAKNVSSLGDFDCDFPSWKLFENPQIVKASSLPVTSSDQVIYRENRNPEASNTAYRESEGFTVSHLEDSLTGNNKNQFGKSGQDLAMQAFFKTYEQAIAEVDFIEDEDENIDENENYEDENESNEDGVEDKGDEGA